MILPSKHIPEHRALLGLGAIILNHINTPRTISALWEKVRIHQSIGTYERYILTLDMLYMLGVIRSNMGLIEKVEI